MNELKTVTQLVKAILEENKQCRNSDSFLYLKILEVYGQKNGVDINAMSVPYFLLTMRDNGFPGFETVRRTRQKVQSECPELCACEKVLGMRMVNETEFRQYARGSVS